MTTNTKIDNLYKIKKHQLELLEYRGYKITGNDKIIMEYDYLNNKDYTDKFKNYYFINNGFNLNNSYFKEENGITTEMKVVYLFLSNKKNIQKDVIVSALDPYVEKLNTETPNYIFRIMFITEVPLKHTDKVFEIIKDTYKFEFFTFDDLVYNATKHFLVPKHKLLSKDEANAYLTNNNIKFDELSSILENDIQVRWLGAKPGDLILITRNSLVNNIISDTSIVRRCVAFYSDKTTSKKKDINYDDMEFE